MPSGASQEYCDGNSLCLVRVWHPHAEAAVPEVELFQRPHRARSNGPGERCEVGDAVPELGCGLTRKPHQKTEIGHTTSDCKHQSASNKHGH